MRSSLSWARRRRLRCLPSPAASSISRRRSRGLRLARSASTLPWRDDRVHLLAEAGVGQHLDHVDQPAARAVEAVLALAVAVERGARSRSRRSRVAAAPSELSITTSTSAALRALHAVAAGEDHVLHRLAAHRQRRLLAERPQHGVGDVRLAASRSGRRPRTRPVPNSSLVRSGKDLKPFIDDRAAGASVGRPPRSRRSSACSAASCSAPFLRLSLPAAELLALDLGDRLKLRSCGGPSSRDGQVGRRPRPAAPAAPAAPTCSRPGARAPPRSARANASTTAGAVRSNPNAR